MHHGNRIPVPYRLLRSSIAVSTNVSNCFGVWEVMCIMFDRFY
jgi:hypothetical protein